MPSFYRPGDPESQINITDAELKKYYGGDVNRLLNSGYALGTFNPSTPLKAVAPQSTAPIGGTTLTFTGKEYVATPTLSTPTWQSATGGQQDAFSRAYREAFKLESTPAGIDKLYNQSLGDVSRLTPAKLEQAAPVALPKVPETTNEAETAVVGAETTAGSYDDYVKRFTTPLTADETKAQSFADEIAKLTGSAGNREADQLAAEKAAGIDTLTTQLSDISSQIKAKSAEFNAFKLAQEGKPITLGSITGSIAQRQGQVASEVLLLQAQGDILQGRLSSAQNNVNRAIDLKYAAEDNKYKIYEAQLQALAPSLSRTDQIRALALNAMNEDRKQKLTDKKQAEKSQTDYLLNLMEKYPDAKINLTDTISVAQAKVQTSKIYQQATRLTGGGTGGGGGKEIIPKVTKEEVKTQNWDNAIQYIRQNADLDDESLRIELRQKTNLAISDINKLIQNRTDYEYVEGVEKTLQDRLFAQGKTVEEVKQLAPEKTPWWKFW